MGLTKPLFDKLNIGSGSDVKKGFVNIDFYQDADVKHDLNKYPYPFPDNSFSVIKARMVMEHLDDNVAFLKELYRIAKPNCHIHIVVPYANSYYLWSDITHKRGYTPSSFTQFVDMNGSDSYYIRPAKFVVKKIRLVPTTTGKFFPRFVREFLSRFIIHIIKDIEVDLIVKK